MQVDVSHSVCHNSPMIFLKNRTILTQETSFNSLQHSILRSEENVNLNYALFWTIITSLVTMLP